MILDPKLKIFPYSALVYSLASYPALAQDYQSGHQALELFDQAAWATTPTWVRYWIMFMAATFAAGLLFVWKHPIARWATGGFILGLIFTSVIAPLFDIPPLSGFIGLCHIIFWSPALYLLVKHKPFLHGASPFAIWSGLMTAVILFSFVFDFRDAFIYLRHVL